MSMEREAEVLEMPTKADTSAKQSRRMAQGRSAIERYVERLKKSAENLADGPEAAELFCALAELREGMIENDPETAKALYEEGLAAFSLSRTANAGLRRIYRANADWQAMVDSLEAEIAVATPERKANLRRELARTQLYCANEPERAIAILETLKEEIPVNETEEGEEADDQPFDPEIFFLWEDALLSTRAWERYEELLNEALSQQVSLDDEMPVYLITRLWVLYQCILPDEEKAAALWETLRSISALDDELVDFGITRAEKLDEQKDAADSLSKLLNDAIERNDVHSPFEIFYRLMLVDLAYYKYNDKDMAFKVLLDGIERFPGNDELIHKNLTLCLENDDYTQLLKKAIPACINIVPTSRLKAEQIHKIAVTLLDDLEPNESALSMLQIANKQCPTYEPTLARLEQIYTSQDNWTELALLLESELSYAISQKDPLYTAEVKIEKYARLAWMYEMKLGLEYKAFNHYQAILQIRPDDLAALKGAARMTQKLGNWKDLLKLYADAQNVVQDMPENNYLLEQIARISIDYHNDLDTACAALEELKKRDLREPQSYAPLAKIYIQLEKWEELIKLTDEDVARSKNAEYKASLLYRNGEISENQLSNIPQATRYYELARTTWSQSRDAYAALKRIYRKQKSFEKLFELIKSHSETVQDVKLKGEMMHEMADIQARELELIDEAITIYEKCLTINPKDDVARKYLLDHYQKEHRWNDVIRILQIELDAGGTFEKKWLTYFWMGSLQLYRLDDPELALDAFEKAVDENHENITLLRIWLDLALRQDKLDQAINKLQNLLENNISAPNKAIIRRIYAELLLRRNHDPEIIADMLIGNENVPGECTNVLTASNSRLLTSIKTMILARREKWVDRMHVAFDSAYPYEITTHALQAAVVMNLPDSLNEYACDALVNLEDPEKARALWASLTPNMRPPFDELAETILDDASREAQDLRRWCAISRLLSGDISEPTDRLLPDNNMLEDMSYRPDLELLAAYFERFENWEKFIWVLEEQEEHTLNEKEHIAIILQRAAALKRQQRFEDSIKAVREACTVCSYENPKRLDLYDYLSKEKDWDFLADTIREHIMHEEDKVKKAALWTRLSNIYGKGKNNLTEALNYLNQAYQNAPGDGSLLIQISKVAHAINELDIARRALDDYIEYHSPSLEKQLEIEPELLDLHFNNPGGDQQRMLLHFEALAKQTAESRETLVILAEAHAKSKLGDPELAASTILRVVKTPELDQEDLPLWIMLADLYLDRLNAPQNGEQLLWKLFENFPEEESIFERLNALYHENHERRILVENIKKSVKASEIIANNPKLTRKYLSFAAKVLSVELKQWNEAQELYTEAIDADTSHDGSLIKEQAFVRSQVPGEAKNAYSAFCDLLIEDPFQVDIYKEALAICQRHQANDRARILLQMAQVFVPDADLNTNDMPSRPKLVDGRPLKEAELVEFLLNPKLKYARTVLLEAMPHIMPNFKDRLPKRTLLGGERVKTHPITQTIELAVKSFQLEPFKLFWGYDATPVPLIFDNDCWLSQECWENVTDDQTIRHWVGYIGGLKWLGLETGPIFDLGSEEIWHQLDGLYYVATNGTSLGERDAYTIEAADKFKLTFMSRNKYKPFAELVDRIGRENLTLADAKLWSDAIRNTADRAGLLFSGSLATSIRALLASDGWNPNKATPEYIKARFERSKRISDLIAFALSDDYLYLRKSAGIATHPSQING